MHPVDRQPRPHKLRKSVADDDDDAHILQILEKT